MPKNKDLDSGSESAKSDHDNQSDGDDGEEEEYVVEKVVDKRITKNGKVRYFVVVLANPNLTCRILHPGAD